MKIRRLTATLLGVAAAVGLAATLVAPLVRPAGDEGHTLVAAEVAMTPDAGEWLAVGDHRDPADWLSGKLGTLDPARASVLIRALATYYEETPRMIANRAVQIADETRGDPPGDQLLADLAWDTQTTRSFGAVAQNYLVLRRQGLDHAAAIAALHDALGDEG